jgi:hypothetical protein
MAARLATSRRADRERAYVAGEAFCSGWDHVIATPCPFREHATDVEWNDLRKCPFIVGKALNELCERGAPPVQATDGLGEASEYGALAFIIAISVDTSASWFSLSN